MTDINQKLREALSEVIAYARESGNDWLCLVEAERAIALPTAAPVWELPELPEPYRALDKHLSHPILRQVLFAPGEYFSADQMRAYARAALSAGDAVDAQRYRLVRRGQHFSVINGIGDTLRGEALDAAADAAMRKGQL